MLVPPLLQLGKDLGRHLKAGHPWVFRKALVDVPKSLPAGTIVDLIEHGSFVARGYLDPHSPIAVRVLTRNQHERIDANFWKKRVETAASLRRGLFDGDGVDGYRIVNGEGDFLPGVIADRYADFAVLKLYSAGLTPHRKHIVDALMASLPLKGVWGRDELGKDGDPFDDDDDARAQGQVLAGERTPPTARARSRSSRFPSAWSHPWLPRQAGCGPALIRATVGMEQDAVSDIAGSDASFASRKKYRHQLLKVAHNYHATV